MPKKSKTVTMQDLGEAIGALPKQEKERRAVRVNLSTFAVYGGTKGPLGNRIGSVLRYTERQGARTPTGGKYTAHRLTVRLRGDVHEWVGQVSKVEMDRKSTHKVVNLRPMETKNA